MFDVSEQAIRAVNKRLKELDRNGSFKSEQAPPARLIDLVRIPSATIRANFLLAFFFGCRVGELKAILKVGWQEVLKREYYEDTRAEYECREPEPHFVLDYYAKCDSVGQPCNPMTTKNHTYTRSFCVCMCCKRVPANKDDCDCKWCEFLECPAAKC